MKNLLRKLTDGVRVVTIIGALAFVGSTFQGCAQKGSYVNDGDNAYFEALEDAPEWVHGMSPKGMVCGVGVENINITNNLSYLKTITITKARNQLAGKVRTSLVRTIKMNEKNNGFKTTSTSSLSSTHYTNMTLFDSEIHKHYVDAENNLHTQVCVTKENANLVLGK